jgi:hypothetical protein
VTLFYKIYQKDTTDTTRIKNGISNLEKKVNRGCPQEVTTVLYKLHTLISNVEKSKRPKVISQIQNVMNGYKCLVMDDEYTVLGDITNWEPTKEN